MSAIVVPQDLIHQLESSLQVYLKKAELALECTFPTPELSFQVRGKVAGKAYLQQWQIRLNPTLLIENQQAFVEQVIPHELAHLITYHQFGRVKPHGKEWRYVMTNIFRCPPETYHAFDISSVQGETFTYQCQCQTHQLSIRRHNKVKRQQTRYHCSLCGTQLEPLIEEKMIYNL
ncbi:MAG: SprT family zinc-dependent metalloprotease [Vibrio litoralis]|uniref:SprT family zinc-dependent metalloprotease n=1 Tax=Vibrio litoralis TaxID=335972 RepID=UPI003F98F977